MKLRSVATNRPDTSVGFPFHSGANWRNSLVLRKGHDLERHGKVDVGLGKKRAKNRPHLLKTNRHVAATFLASVGDNREVGRFDLHPLRLSCKRRSRGKQACGQRNDETD